MGKNELHIHIHTIFIYGSVKCVVRMTDAEFRSIGIKGAGVQQ